MRLKLKYSVLFVLICFLSFGFIRAVYSQEVISNKEIDFLNSEINSKKNEIDKIKQEREKYSEEIERIQGEQASLKNQLAILDNKLAKAELDIEDTKAKIQKSNLEIRKVNFEIESRENQIEEEKKHISEILNLMYKQSQVDTLEVLLMNDSLSDFLNKIRYLEDVNKEMENSVQELKQYKEDLELNKNELEEESNNLVKLKGELEERQMALSDERETKGFILDQTEESEERYQGLLGQAKREAEEASNEIVALEKMVREEMEKLSEDDEMKVDSGGLGWPVSNRRITAYFHDPDYPFRYLFEHPAIDIASPQGSTIRSSGSGYVARVKFDPNSSSYGYIMIVHADGLATVYGHISKPLVAEEEYVTKGQSIALSGGMPGTAGSGNLTSGPHLHFEVRLNGIPVNPLNYLP
ncbi:peptidoglycan DD-metalloendopeptidase family protein [bacterium]|nr:peptidoglycan DD-metalloendopeptidase family protein [bacterium]